MVSRKAILNAFEVVLGDSDIKTVTAFCPNRPKVSTFRMERVRVTRDSKSRNSYRVQLGRMNYAERKFVEKHIVKHHFTPKLWIVRKAK